MLELIQPLDLQQENSELVVLRAARVHVDDGRGLEPQTTGHHLQPLAHPVSSVRDGQRNPRKLLHLGWDGCTVYALRVSCGLVINNDTSRH